MRPTLNKIKRRLFLFIKMSKLRVTGEVSRIPSKVYHKLFEKGGDPLIALFCILKKSKETEKYLSYKNSRGLNVGGYGLLRKQTNIALNSLKRYVPLLIELEFLSFNTNGDVYIKGTNKLIKEYENTKLVPIKIGGTFKQTQYNSISVRLHSNQDNQNKQIAKKHIQNEKYSKGIDPKNYQQLQYYKEIQKGSLKRVSVIDTVVLSNESYSRIKGGGGSHKKSRGSYWKSKLKELKLIKSERRFEKVAKMSLKEYSYFRASGLELNVGRYRYSNGWLIKEVVSKFEALDSINEKEPANKPIPMDFDFIGWLDNNPHINKNTYKSAWSKKV